LDLCDATWKHYLPTEKALSSSLASLQRDWPTTSFANSAIQGMAGLMSLENIVGKSPFGKQAGDALQTLLGKWDGVKIPTSIFGDWEARRKFYFERGFDARLTAFPGITSDSALSLSGLFGGDLHTPVIPPPLEKTAEERSVERHPQRRMLDAYDLLFNLERQIRDSLSEAMVTRFGQDWVKHRVPGELHQQWKEKRAAALKNGETEHPILDYSDFTDYVRIIIRKDNWEDVFEAAFHNKTDIQISFQRLYPIRLCTMHARTITKEDFLVLLVEKKRILKALQKLRKLNEDHPPFE
jgi:hypothetical protein